MDSWHHIKNYLQSSECRKLHKMAYWSAGWCYITDKRGERHLVSDMDLMKVVDIVNNIKLINSSS